MRVWSSRCEVAHWRSRRRNRLARLATPSASDGSAVKPILECRAFKRSSETVCCCPLQDDLRTDTKSGRLSSQELAVKKNHGERAACRVLRMVVSGGREERKEREMAASEPTAFLWRLAKVTTKLGQGQVYRATTIPGMFF